MSPELLYALHIAISVLAGSTAGLLGYMFWNSSITNSSKFTSMFLRLLSLCFALRAVEIACSAYRTSQIAADAIPRMATVIGLAGRGIEMFGYIVMIWFLLRPETKRRLNGVGPPLVAPIIDPENLGGRK